jgi:hypothetical protein
VRGQPLFDRRQDMSAAAPAIRTLDLSRYYGKASATIHALSEALARRWQNRNGAGPQVRLTPQRIEELRHLDRVESVRPIVEIYGRAVLGKRSENGTILAADFGNDRLRGRLVAGRLPGPGEDGGVVLSEGMLFFLGVRSDAEVEQALGRKVRVEYRVGGRSPHLLLVLLQGDASSVGPDDEKILDKALAHSMPGDAWVRSMVNRQLTLKREESLFAFPWWLVAGAPLFAALVTTLAAVLPARRAARINPVEALRHE